MNKAIQLEDKVSRSRSKHEGESSPGHLRQAFGRTRGRSQRQLPTDHDYAVSTREYQLDQSSPFPATAAADPVLDRKKRLAHLDRSLHINVRIAGYPLTTSLLVPLTTSGLGSCGPYGALLRHLRLPRLSRQARLFVHLDPLLARNRRDQLANRFEWQIVRRLENERNISPCRASSPPP